MPLHRNYNVVINWCHKSVINSSRASVISEIKNAINWKDTCLCIMSIGESSALDIIRSDNIHSSSCPRACYTLASLIPLPAVKWTRVFARNVKNSLLLIKRWLSSAFRRILKFIKHVAYCTRFYDKFSHSSWYNNVKMEFQTKEKILDHTRYEEILISKFSSSSESRYDCLWLYRCLFM